MTKKQRNRRKARRQQSVKRAQVAARHDREKTIKRRLRARERVILPAGREWLAVEAYPLSGSRCARALAAAGLPVFEAREKVREQREGGPPRVAMVPIMRRVMFVGLRGWSDMRLIEECRHVWQVFGIVGDGFGWIHREQFRQALLDADICGDRAVPFVAPGPMQEFADHVCDYKRWDPLTETSHVVTSDEALALLYRMGDRVRVTGGPFASFPGVVEAHDRKTDLYTVGVSIFGRVAEVLCEEGHLEAA